VSGTNRLGLVIPAFSSGLLNGDVPFDDSSRLNEWKQATGLELLE